MKTTILSGTALVATLVVAGFSCAWGSPHDRKDPPEVKQQVQLPQPNTAPQVGRGGQVGGMDEMIDVDYMHLMQEVDSTMQRMTGLMDKSRVLSKSFEELAALHQGADKSEIQMMKRMSDSMGIMAGEIRTSLQQYKQLLSDETVSETGKMKAEVQSLRAMMDGIGYDVEQSLETLQTLQDQLGQG